MNCFFRDFPTFPYSKNSTVINNSLSYLKLIKNEGSTCYKSRDIEIENFTARSSLKIRS